MGDAQGAIGGTQDPVSGARDLVNGARRGWHGQLDLSYTFEHARSVARYAHNGPLRVLQSLYPEGDAVCHNVLVHPPGGLVGGDVLDIQVRVGEHAHGLVTTPGATRFYRSEQGLAMQSVQAALAEHSRLEWLPLETIAYDRCDGLNRAVFQLAPTAELMAWDITALGLPSAGQPFAQGRLMQHFEVEGAWLERGLIAGDDALLLDGPLGLAGHRCMGTLILARGSAWDRETREQALDLAREQIEQVCVANGDGTPPCIEAGVTAADPRVLVLRTLSPLVEPTQQLLRAVWARWRQAIWHQEGTPPRIWAM